MHLSSSCFEKRQHQALRAAMPDKPTMTFYSRRAGGSTGARARTVAVSLPNVPQIASEPHYQPPSHQLHPRPTYSPEAPHRARPVDPRPRGGPPPRHWLTGEKL
jgi:hypothetical protein